MKRTDLRAYGYLVVAALFWSGNVVLARAFSADLPPVALSYWRWMLAWICLMPFCWRHIWTQKELIAKNFWKLAILSLLSIGCYNLTVYTGLQTTTAMNSVLITSSSPLMILLISRVFFRSALGKYEVIGIIVSFIGASFIISQGDLAHLQNLAQHTGDLWIGLATLFWSVYSLLLPRWKPQSLNPTAFLGTIISIGVIFVGMLYWTNLFQEPEVNWDLTKASVILYVAIFPATLGYLCWNEGVRLIGPQMAGQFIHLMPVFGVLLAMIFLGESFQIYHWIGSSFIALGIILSHYSQSKIH